MIATCPIDIESLHSILMISKQLVVQQEKTKNIKNIKTKPIKKIKNKTSYKMKKQKYLLLSLSVCVC